MLITHKDFFLRHFNLCQNMKQREAYEICEKEWAQIHEGRRKYKDFDSFKAAKNGYYREILR